MKEVEEELVLHIRNIFENFDDEGSESGWAALRQKYPETPNKKLPIYWISGIAAALLITIGLLLNLNKPTQTIELTTGIKQNPVHHQKIDSPVKEQTIIKNNAIVKAVKIAPKGIEKSEKEIKNQSIIETPFKQGDLITKIEKPLKNTTIIEVKPIKEIKKEAIVQNNVIANKVDTAQKSFTQTQVIASNVAVKPIEEIKKEVIAQNNIIANKADTIPKPLTQTQAIANSVEVGKKPANIKKTTADFLNEQSKILAQKPKEVEKTNSLKNSIDIFSGTFLNYQGDNSSKLNAGFGINANVKVAKSLFLSLGAGISQNKITFNDYHENSGLLLDVQSSVSPGNSNGNVTVKSPVKLNAQLLNFDIPISLKFYPTKKQNFYLTTGINSNTYISQKYTYSYSLNTTNTSGYSSVQNQEETQQNKFKGFDFGTTAIFGFGVSQDIGHNSFIFEPFFKPALGNIGDKNLRINSVGLNLKFSFSAKTKK